MRAGAAYGLRAACGPRAAHRRAANRSAYGRAACGCALRTEGRRADCVRASDELSRSVLRAADVLRAGSVLCTGGRRIAVWACYVRACCV